jgi:hypothetical protein
MMDFFSNHVFNMKKADKSKNFTASELTMAGNIITHSVETRTIIRKPVIVIL